MPKSASMEHPWAASHIIVLRGSEKNNGKMSFLIQSVGCFAQCQMLHAPAYRHLRLFARRARGRRDMRNKHDECDGGREGLCAEPQVPMPGRRRRRRAHGLRLDDGVAAARVPSPPVENGRTRGVGARAGGHRRPEVPGRSSRQHRDV